MTTYYVRTDGNDANSGLANDASHAWLTVQKALNTVANGDIVYVVGTGVYSIGTGLMASTGAGSVTFTAKTRIIGCTATPGDGGKATIRATAGINLLTISGSGWSFESLDFDGNNVSSCRGINVTGQYNAAVDCKVRNFTNNGLNTANVFSYFVFQRGEVTGCSTQPAIAIGNGTDIIDSWIHDNTVRGIDGTGGQANTIINCIVSNNTGASSDGIYSSYHTTIRNNVCHGNGRHGILLDQNYIGIQSSVQNNVITSNGGYGLKFLTTSATLDSQQIDYNFYHANTSGPVNNLNQSAHDVLLTADPYTNAAGNDFSLNMVAGGGAAVRAAGFPGLFPGGLTRGYIDGGAAQHADPTFNTPPKPTVILTDKADGTGATAIISNSDPSSTNTVLAAKWVLGGPVTTPFSVVASRTGNGSLNVPLSPGFYWIYVHSILGSNSIDSDHVSVRATEGDAVPAIRSRLTLQLIGGRQKVQVPNA